MSSPIMAGIDACVFDAYGTLFDVGGVTRAAATELGELCGPLAEAWRAKQLQYTWLRGLAGHHADFWQVTGDALDFAMSQMRLGDAGLRERLMALYLDIPVYPEVPAALRQLRDAGMRLAILSNGTPGMLTAAVNKARLSTLFEAVLSVEDVGVFKPHPSVYAMVPQRLGIVPGRICFVSANGWDAWSAKAFGFRVLWCNRLAAPAERLPSPPDGELPDLSTMAAYVVRG